jgi:hypothetical protein
MKKLFIMILCLCSIDTYAQSPIAYNLHAITTTSSLANSSPPGEWSRVVSDGAFFSFDRVAQTYGDPNRALPPEYYQIDAEARSRLYNSYSPSGTENTPARNNPTANFFDSRRMNGYNRDMEEWRRSEKARLKRYGIYDREAIRYLYSP